MTYFSGVNDLNRITRAYFALPLWDAVLYYLPVTAYGLFPRRTFDFSLLTSTIKLSGKNFIHLWP